MATKSAENDALSAEITALKEAATAEKFSHESEISAWKSSNSALKKILELFREQVQLLGRHTAAARTKVERERRPEALMALEDIVVPAVGNLGTRIGRLEREVRGLKEKR